MLFFLLTEPIFSFEAIILVQSSSNFEELALAQNLWGNTDY